MCFFCFQYAFLAKDREVLSRLCRYFLTPKHSPWIGKMEKYFFFSMWHNLSKCGKGFIFLNAIREFEAPKIFLKMSFKLLNKLQHFKLDYFDPIKIVSHSFSFVWTSRYLTESLYTHSCSYLNAVLLIKIAI